MRFKANPRTHHAVVDSGSMRLGDLQRNAKVEAAVVAELGLGKASIAKIPGM